MIVIVYNRHKYQMEQWDYVKIRRTSLPDIQDSKDYRRQMEDYNPLELIPGHQKVRRVAPSCWWYYRVHAHQTAARTGDRWIYQQANISGDPAQGRVFTLRSGQKIYPCVGGFGCMGGWEFGLSLFSVFRNIAYASKYLKYAFWKSNNMDTGNVCQWCLHMLCRSIISLDQNKKYNLTITICVTTI